MPPTCRSRQALLQANFEVADLTNTVGRKEAALAAHRRVLAAQEALAAEPGAGAETKAEVGRSLTAIATLLEGIGKTDEAVATYRKADGLLAAAAVSAPAGSPVRAALADCRSRLGYLLYTTGHADDGLLVLRQAQTDQEVLAEADGAAKEARRDLASTINRIGNLLLENRPAGRRRRSISQGDGDLREAGRRKPRRHRIPASPGIHAQQPRRSVPDTGKLVESEAEFRDAMTLRQKLADDNPAVTQFRNGLALGHRNLGKVLWDRGRPSEAEAEYQQSDRDLSRAGRRQRSPSPNSESGWRTATPRSPSCSIKRAGGRSRRPSSAQAMAVRQKLANDDPTLTEVQSDLAQSHHNLGYLLSDTGKPAKAEAEYRKSLVIYQKLVDDNPAVTRFRDSLANSHLDLGILLSQTGRPAEAEAEQRKAVALYQKLTDDNPEVPEPSVWPRRCPLLSRRRDPPARPGGRGARSLRTSDRHSRTAGQRESRNRGTAASWPTRCGGAG